MRVYPNVWDLSGPKPYFEYPYFYTADLGLVYNYSNLLLEEYSNFNWGGDFNTKKSTLKYIFRFGNSVIFWGTILQKAVGLLFCEAKYMALKKVIKK